MLGRKKDLIRFDIATNQGGATVIGLPIRIEGFEGFTFILHRPLGKTRLWMVTEKSTGRSIPFGPIHKGTAKTRKEAITLASQWIRETHTPETFEGLIKSFGRLKAY